MKRRVRDLTRAAATIAAQTNSRFTGVEYTGRGHWRLVFFKNGNTIAMYAASSPSDNHRDLKNTVAQARRALRQTV